MARDAVSLFCAGYAQALLESFGPERLIWASDYPPCVTGGDVSFPQTLSLLAEMPFLSETDRAKIEGGNLLGLLEDAEAGNRAGSAAL